MPNFTHPLVSVEKTLLTEIYFKIIDDIAEFVNVNPDTVTLLRNSLQMSRTDLKVNIERPGEHNTPTVAGTVSTLEASVTDTYDEDTLYTNFTSRDDAFPVFLDPEVNVRVAPIYITRDLTFNFKYVGHSRSEINDMRNRIRIQLSKVLQLIKHDIKYSMVFPKVFEKFVCDVYDLKSRLVEIELDEYFRKSTDSRIHLQTDTSPKKENARFAIQEEQIDVFGRLEFTSPPEDSRDNTRNEHILEFDYIVKMDIPVALTFNYPVMIANRLMPDEYINAIEQVQNERLDKQTNHYLGLGKTLTTLNNFSNRAYSKLSPSHIYPMNNPTYDGYKTPTRVPGYGVVMTVLTDIKEDGSYHLLNLKELGDWFMPDHILDYIRKGNHARVTKAYESFFFLGLDQEGVHYNNDILRLDENLDLYCTKPLNYMKICRVLFNTCTDWSFLSETAKRELKKDPDLFNTFLKEYLFVKPDILPSRRDEFFGRDETLIGEVVRMMKRHIDNMDYDYVTEMVKVLQAEPHFNKLLARNITNGWIELYNDLRNEKIAYTDDRGMLVPYGTHSDKPYTEDEIGDRRRDYDRRGHTVNGEVPHAVQRDVRETVTRPHPRTVMKNSLLVMRGGNA